MINIRQATQSDADWIQSSFDTYMGWRKPQGYFAECCVLQQQDKLELWIATHEAQYTGHLKVVWESDYPHFRDNHIPEIQDLNVCPVFRQQGIATQLLDEAETRIKTRSDVAGIGFGLYADYGAAQRLYIKRGYVPDGQGVFYNYQPIEAGVSYPVDDDLVLYLTKRL